MDLHSRNHFAVLPEVGVNLGYHVTQNLCVFAGYDFMFLSSVVRAGEQVDTRVNTTQVPFFNGPISGPSVPAFTFHDSTFWAHGVSFGLDFRY